MRWNQRPRGLRSRIVLGFAAGTLLVSAVLVVTTFVLARNYLLDQRERSAVRQALTDASLLRSRLSTAGTEVGDALGELVPSGGGDVVVRSGGAWYSSSLEVGARDVPTVLQEQVAAGEPATARTDSRTGPRVVVGTRLPGTDVEFYELAPLTELELSLRTLGAVLAAGAGAATLAGAAFGSWASRRAVQPLEQVAGAATAIAGGDLATRLPPTDDPDLIAIVGSFNSMVDALSARIDRDARFVGDVSHELRSPLTSLVTTVEVLAGRRDDLTPRGREALALVQSELDRFRRTLDDLLELAKLDNSRDSPGADDASPGTAAPAVSVAALVREVLERTGHPVDLLAADDEESTTVLARKLPLERAVRNLVENADRHAGGVRAVQVQRLGDSVVLHVDDDGPGVAAEDRERVFERFARGPRAARGSLPGAGLGLAIVAETATHLGGAAWCAPGPDGGARFSIALPAASSAPALPAASS
ncbi:sensor histidine kinase [Modestobacter roseus]|uniref:histidine kinase n=1 Tax=Modestobacter roseus TaxID=1181884 RepID=A0A562IQ04_9ACTN|nr:HAMP domain-containing sensor histidine kinase [Modestobacter roseus]TWH73109.1 signal transduction histidine kinase [Modestobacter roseus]